MHTIGVFATVFDTDGKVLLVKQNYGALEWACPGGRLEQGENLIEGIEREALEESGCRIAVTGLVGTYIAPYRNDLVVSFRAQLIERGPWQPDHEISQIGFFQPGALPDPISFATAVRLRDSIAGISGAVRSFVRRQGKVDVISHLED